MKWDWNQIGEKVVDQAPPLAAIAIGTYLIGRWALRKIAKDLKGTSKTGGARIGRIG